MKTIQNKNLLIALIGFLLLALASCKEDNGFREPIDTDTTKPGVITNVKVTNYNGGAFITYKLPQVGNVLYVKARYEIRPGVFRETKSSFYSDTLNVEGFAKAQAYNVTVQTVTRADISSDPITVSVNPLTPVYALVRNATDIAADFGGVNVAATNVAGKEIGIVLLALDPSTNALEVQDQHYGKDKSINYSIRGYSTTARNFGVYVTDKFGNVSDTLKKSITPLFEQMLNKSQFFTYSLASDSEIGYGWEPQYLWDNKTDNNSQGWHSNPTGKLPPYVVTFGLGPKQYKLSRFLMYERIESNFTYKRGNPSDFAIWGTSVNNPASAVLPLKVAPGTVVGDWICLQNYHFPDPPSGLAPGNTNAADEEFVKAGVSFDVPSAAPPIRYIRVAVQDTWGKMDMAHFMELTFFGREQ